MEQLFSAVINRNVEEAERLIHAGASVHSVDKHGRTPLHHAAQRGYVDLAEYLIKIGADVNSVDNFGNTSLHLTAHSGYIKDNGVWANIEEAAKFRHKNTVELLLKKGANINAVNHQMQTPLHIAAEGRHSYLLEALLKKGAAVNLVDDEGNTPLHCVGGMGGGEDDKEVIKLLLKAGADINLVNREGDTPLGSYDLRSNHLSADMKLMIVHITKLKAAGLFINQRNIQFMDELVRFWRGRNNNFLQNLPRWFSKFSKEVSKLSKENSVLYTFLKESNINVLVKMWEESEYIRNKFIGRDLNKEKELKEVLKERYSKYADILINKADDVRKKIFLHNNKLLLDSLSAHYKCNFKDVTFIGIRSFFDLHKEDLKEKLGLPLLDLIDLSDVRKNIPILKVQAFAEIVKPSRDLNNSNAEQHQGNSLAT